MNREQILDILRTEAERLQVKVTEKGPGHFHLQGSCLVNYYPFSKDRTAFVAGRDKVKHVGPYSAMVMALDDPEEAPPPETHYTLFGRAVSEAEWRAFEMDNKGEGPPWK